MAKAEYFHCKKLSTGIACFFLNICLYLVFFKVFSLLNFYLLLYILKSTVYIYVAFRGCFLSENNIILKHHFSEFNRLYMVLQKIDHVYNRSLFLQLYSVFFLFIQGIHTFQNTVIKKKLSSLFIKFVKKNHNIRIKQERPLLCTQRYTLTQGTTTCCKTRHNIEIQKHPKH